MSERFPLSARGLLVTWGLVRLGDKVYGRTGARALLRSIAHFARLTFWWWRLGDIDKAVRRLRPNIDEEARAFLGERSRS